MYDCTERDDRIKLIDFGFSRILGCIDETLDMPCGTVLYTSPEVLTKNYTSKCDLWSLGVISYMLLMGKPPFCGGNNVRIARTIIHGDYSRDGRWQDLSESAQDFVQLLLNRDVEQRPSATMALSHPWVTVSGQQGNAADIGVDVLRSLRRFAQGSHLRRVALNMLAYGLTSQELKDLEDTFLAFDTSGRGTITLDQLANVLRKHVEGEVSSQEVKRIFESLDVSGNDEVHYTPFVAAMLATRVNMYEDRVRAAFEAFDRDHSGYITAESLMRLFGSSGSQIGAGLTREEAEQWIREVDVQGNGLVDYDAFLAALMATRLWTHSVTTDTADHPIVRVFSESDSRPQGRSDSFVDAMPGSALSKIRHRLASAIIDAEVEGVRPQTFDCSGSGRPVHFHNVPCEFDENHFA